MSINRNDTQCFGIGVLRISRSPIRQRMVIGKYSLIRYIMRSLINLELIVSFSYICTTAFHRCGDLRVVKRFSMLEAGVVEPVERDIVISDCLPPMF